MPPSCLARRFASSWGRHRWADDRVRSAAPARDEQINSVGIVELPNRDRRERPLIGIIPDTEPGLAARVPGILVDVRRDFGFTVVLQFCSVVRTEPVEHLGLEPSKRSFAVSVFMPVIPGGVLWISFARMPSGLIWRGNVWR